MTHVSDKKLSQDFEKVLSSLLETTLTNLNNKEIQLFLNSLFSETETIMFKKRLGIIFLLELKATNKQIEHYLKTTPQTIARIKKQWKATQPKVKEFILHKLNEAYLQKETKNLLSVLLNKK